jgi:hypothetical protein
MAKLFRSKVLHLRTEEIFRQNSSEANRVAGLFYDPRAMVELVQRIQANADYIRASLYEGYPSQVSKLPTHGDDLLAFEEAFIPKITSFHRAQGMACAQSTLNLVAVLVEYPSQWYGQSLEMQTNIAQKACLEFIALGNLEAEDFGLGAAFIIEDEDGGKVDVLAAYETRYPDAFSHLKPTVQNQAPRPSVRVRSSSSSSITVTSPLQGLSPSPFLTSNDQRKALRTGVPAMFVNIQGAQPPVVLMLGRLLLGLPKSLAIDEQVDSHGDIGWEDNTRLGLAFRVYVYEAFRETGLSNPMATGKFIEGGAQQHGSVTNDDLVALAREIDSR